MVIKMLNELSRNYKEFQGTYKELTMNYTSMKKDIKTINKTRRK